MNFTLQLYRLICAPNRVPFDGDVKYRFYTVREVRLTDVASAMMRVAHAESCKLTLPT
jgi:hypothetical protein